MNKKMYRFFSLFIEKQQEYLNRMANNGWRLIKTSQLMYEFAPSSPKEYEYKVIYIGEKSYSRNKEYRSFFKDMGYDVFTKNTNLNYSIGKFAGVLMAKAAARLPHHPEAIIRRY